MKKVNMLEGSVTRSIVMFSIPMYLTYLIQLLYYTTDTIFVGRFLGTDAQAAVGASGTLVTMMIGLLGGITTGVSVLVSRYYGAQDRHGLTLSTTAAAWLSLILSILLAAFGVLFSRTFLTLIHTPESILDMATAYLQIYCCSLPAMVLYNVGLGMLRATGDSFRPMLFQIVGGVCNVIFDFVFLVFLRMEAVGSAWGTLAAQSIVAVIVVIYVLKQKDTFRLQRFDQTTLRGEFQKILSVGAPAGLQAMLITLSNVLIQSEINRLGTVAIAAFTAYFEVELLIYYPILAFGQAISVFVGQNFGAQQSRRACYGVRVVTRIGVLFTLASSLFCIVLAPLLFGIFSKDADVIAFGVKVARITFPFYFLYVFLQVYGDALRAMRYSFPVMLIVLLNVGLLRVTLMYAFQAIFGTVEMLVSIYPITWFTAGVTMTAYYFYKRRTAPDFVLEPEPEPVPEE